jgi:hypothetical protein
MLCKLWLHLNHLITHRDLVFLSHYYLIVYKQVQSGSDELYEVRRRWRSKCYVLLPVYYLGNYCMRLCLTFTLRHLILL